MNKITGTPHHLAVWVDHRVARLYALTHDDSQMALVRNNDTGEGDIHHHAGSVGAGHVAPGRPFLENISDAIGMAQEILILGPSDAKTELRTFLANHKQHMAENIVAVEPMDHASDGEIVDFARRFFARADRMRPRKS